VLAGVFDLDGTLIDSESIYRTALVQALGELGLAADEAFVHGLNGLSGTAVSGRILAQYGADFPADAFRRVYVARRDALMGAGIPLKPGAAEALRFVAGRGLKLALATSALRESAVAHLRRLQVLAHFDVLVAREDVAQAKPFPDAFLAAASRLGVAAADCLAVEDSHAGVQAALAAGMMTAMVPDVAAPTEEMRARCVAVWGSLRELPGMFGAGG
jgi:HAD superfamily hydrolase (TIGR01509 family)